VEDAVLVERDAPPAHSGRRTQPERRMVLVVGWIDADHADEFSGRELKAIDDP
jgi:hypothetical protein